jgi:hypothetical protein
MQPPARSPAKRRSACKGGREFIAKIVCHRGASSQHEAGGVPRARLGRASRPLKKSRGLRAASSTACQRRRGAETQLSSRAPRLRGFLKPHPSMSQNSKPPQAEAAEASAPLASPEDEGRNPVWRIWAGVAVLMLVAFWFAWQFVGDPPPKQIRIATGSANGGYDRGGQALRDALARDGIEVLLRQSAGSLENLELLQAGEVDVAFVQGAPSPRPAGSSSRVKSPELLGSSPSRASTSSRFGSSSARTARSPSSAICAGAGSRSALRVVARAASCSSCCAPTAPRRTPRSWAS